MNGTEKALNDVEVSADDLARANDAAIREGERVDADAMIAVAMEFRGERQPLQITAIFFRLQALASLIVNGTLESWTLKTKTERGEVYVNAAVYDAAAVCALKFKDDEAVFDEQEFLRLVLNYSEDEGRA